MARDWEKQLAEWSVGPGKTEEEKMDHAVTGIETAIRKSPVLGGNEIETLGTGSFKNRTHIPTESDVDVAVILKDVFVSKWDFADPRAKTEPAVVEELMREAGVTTTSYTYIEYKNQVEIALVDHFGRANVERGDKAFDITENTYRVESDAVAMFEHRQWRRDEITRRLVYTAGTMFYPDSDPEKAILNYPKQQFEKGEAKHNRTGRRYKKMVRIIKNLCNEMSDNGIAAARPIPSFLIECLVYQVPDGFFGAATFYEELDDALAFIAVNTSTDEKCDKWTEVNQIKYLFRQGQPWTRAQAFDFAMAARTYVGFE